MLGDLEIDTDERIAAVVVFDLDDIDAAIAELDARYLAGEAAAHAHTWSVIAGLRRDQPARASATTSDWVNSTIDAERVRARRPDRIHPCRVGPADVNTYVEAVHRLNELGAVITHVA